MSYVQHVLQPGEELVYSTRLHWLVYLKTVFFLIITLVLAIGWLTQRTASYPNSDDVALVLLAATGIFLVLTLIFAIGATIRRASTELAVTSQRVIFKRGILGRYTVEMARSKVESVDVVQSLLGRIFNFGTILVRGTGGTLEPFRDIENPIRLRSSITVS